MVLFRPSATLPCLMQFAVDILRFNQQFVLKTVGTLGRFQAVHKPVHNDLFKIECLLERNVNIIVSFVYE
jgi:hypothetical protein